MVSWEIALVFGMSFVPLFLQKSSEEMKSPVFKTFIFIVNLFLVGAMLRVAQQIAVLNDAGIATSMGIFYTAYIYIALIALVIFLLVLANSGVNKNIL